MLVYRQFSPELNALNRHNRPEASSCADLNRSHIEDYQSWIGARHGRYTGKPLNRVSIKNRLINLHCFFDRVAEWGYANPPQRPLIFTGDLPIIDKPLPRFLDDAAATKLMRASRADPDPLSRLIVELLARTGIRKGELLTLAVAGQMRPGGRMSVRGLRGRGRMGPSPARRRRPRTLRKP